MFENHLNLQREDRQEDRAQAREATVFTAQQAFDSKKFCRNFRAEDHKEEEVSYRYREFIVEWSDVDTKMTILRFRPLYKYRTLRNHLKGKALEMTFAQFPTDRHYQWALDQLEVTFYNHAHQCASLFAKILSLQDLSLIHI